LRAGSGVMRVGAGPLRRRVRGRIRPDRSGRHSASLFTRPRRAGGHL